MSNPLRFRVNGFNRVHHFRHEFYLKLEGLESFTLQKVFLDTTVALLLCNIKYYHIQETLF